MIELFARSPKMREAVSLAERVSATDANVLITGESGAGKDLLATFIHSKSRRATQPFVKIDCATLPGEFVIKPVRVLGEVGVPDGLDVRRDAGRGRLRTARPALALPC